MFHAAHCFSNAYDHFLLLEYTTVRNAIRIRVLSRPLKKEPFYIIKFFHYIHELCMSNFPFLLYLHKYIGTCGFSELLHRFITTIIPVVQNSVIYDRFFARNTLPFEQKLFNIAKDVHYS